jgi:hypothetical protein
MLTSPTELQLRFRGMALWDSSTGPDDYNVQAVVVFLDLTLKDATLQLNFL